MLCSLISSAFSDFGLDKVPHGGADDGLVVSGDVVLGYFALVDDLLLSEEVCGVALLQECVSFRTSTPRSFSSRTVSSRSTVLRAKREIDLVRIRSIAPFRARASISWNWGRCVGCVSA